MSTFSAHDQRRMSLFIAPFGYLVSTSALTKLIPPADAMGIISTTKSGQKLCFEGHIYTKKNECIGKDQISWRCV